LFARANRKEQKANKTSKTAGVQCSDIHVLLFNINHVLAGYALVANKLTAWSGGLA